MAVVFVSLMLVGHITARYYTTGKRRYGNDTAAAQTIAGRRRRLEHAGRRCLITLPYLAENRDNFIHAALASDSHLLNTRDKPNDLLQN